MNGDQKMVATLGLILILFVIFGVYRKTLSAILFNAPASNMNVGPNINPGNGGSPLNLLNPFNWISSAPPTPTDQTNGTSTNSNPAPPPTMTIGGSLPPGTIIGSA